MANANSTTREGESCTRNWSNLHFDPLALVVRKIQCIEDFFSFRAVCVWWRSAATKENFNGTPRLPWLVRVQNEYSIVSLKKKNNNNSHRIANVIDNMHTRAILPLKNIGSYCLGWKGWILVLEDNGKMNLLHAFLRTTIKLPNISTLERRYVLVKKAALTSNPFTTPSDYTIMITFHFCSLVAFWSPGDESFTKVHFPNCEDVICYNGLFYCIDRRGSIMVFDVKGTKLFVPGVGIPRLDRLDHDGLYLVELAGEVLIVARINLKIGVRFLVWVFRQGELLRVDAVGNRAIFIGLNTSFSVDAFEITGCKANHIYFTDHRRFYATWKNDERKHQMGVYNLSNGKVEYFHCSANDPFYRCSRPPLWLTPSFF